MRVLVGIVGYCSFVRAYPLGPELLARIQAPPWPQDLEIRELNWGPVAIVQELEAMDRQPERVVLVSTVARGRPVNSVHCRLWQGGRLAVDELQKRMFEAVTGIVHLDNLLAIGTHFGVWPKEVLTIEVELQHSNVGDYILAELADTAGSSNGVGEVPPTAEMAKLIDTLATLTRRAALEGSGGLADLLPLEASELTPIAEFCHSHSLSEPITR